jgi:four helix bundle protein
MAPPTRKKVAVRSFRELIAWQKAMLLVERTYTATAAFPDTEKFGLTSQMRRAAVSIASNVAEGQSRNTRGEFVQFIGHARGSLAELETQVLLSTRLGFLSTSDESALMEDVMEVGRLLNGLRTSLTAVKSEFQQ